MAHAAAHPALLQALQSACLAAAHQPAWLLRCRALHCAPQAQVACVTACSAPQLSRGFSCAAVTDQQKQQQWLPRATQAGAQQPGQQQVDSSASTSPTPAPAWPSQHSPAQSPHPQSLLSGLSKQQQQQQQTARLAALATANACNSASQHSSWPCRLGCGHLQHFTHPWAPPLSAAAAAAAAAEAAAAGAAAAAAPWRMFPPLGLLQQQLLPSQHGGHRWLCTSTSSSLHHSAGAPAAAAATGGMDAAAGAAAAASTQQQQQAAAAAAGAFLGDDTFDDPDEGEVLLDEFEAGAEDYDNGVQDSEWTNEGAVSTSSHGLRGVEEEGDSADEYEVQFDVEFDEGFDWEDEEGLQDDAA